MEHMGVREDLQVVGVRDEDEDRERWRLIRCGDSQKSWVKLKRAIFLYGEISWSSNLVT